VELLAANFNPHTVEGLMCRDTLSVDYRGRLYDCDFNQMLDMPLAGRTVSGEPPPRADARGSDLHLWDITADWLNNRPIRTQFHCLACTAGSGSSCTGALN
jgi:hypothetical protein